MSKSWLASSEWRQSGLSAPFREIRLSVYDFCIIFDEEIIIDANFSAQKKENFD